MGVALGSKRRSGSLRFCVVFFRDQWICGIHIGRKSCMGLGYDPVYSGRRKPIAPCNVLLTFDPETVGAQDICLARRQGHHPFGQPDKGLTVLQLSFDRGPVTRYIIVQFKRRDPFADLSATVIQRQVAHDPAQETAWTCDIRANRLAAQTPHGRVLNHIFGAVAIADNTHRIAQQHFTFVNQVTQQFLPCQSTACGDGFL